MSSASPLVKGGAQALHDQQPDLQSRPPRGALQPDDLEWVGQDYVTGEITAVGNVMRGGNDTDEGLPFLMLGGDGDLAYYGRTIARSIGTASRCRSSAAMARPRPS